MPAAVPFDLIVPLTEAQRAIVTTAIAAFVAWARDEQGARLSCWTESPFSDEDVVDMVATFTGVSPDAVAPLLARPDAG